MGVPKLFGSLLKDVPDGKRAQRSNFDLLCFDLNGLIHSSYEKVLLEDRISHSGVYDDGSPVDMDIFRHSVCKTVVRDIQIAIEKTSPKAVLIATDGVAPAAKITQQRKRRFLSDDFFRSQISPGTPFMQLLKTYIGNNMSADSKHKGVIGKYAKTIKAIGGRWTYNNVWLSEDLKKVYPGIYSSDMSAGEGEAKIFTFLDSTFGNFKGSVCIHGLDADIIVRSFISRVNNITLWHEPKPNDYDGRDTFFSITALRKYFKDKITSYGVFTPDKVKKVKQSNKSKNIPHDQFYKNLFFMVTLIFGNDFIPKIPNFAHTISIPYILESLSAFYHNKEDVDQFIGDVTFMHTGYSEHSSSFEFILGVIILSISLRPVDYVEDKNPGGYIKDVKSGKLKIPSTEEYEKRSIEEFRYLKTVQTNHASRKRGRNKMQEDYLAPFMNMIKDSKDISILKYNWKPVVSSVNSSENIEDCLGELISNGWLLDDDSDLSMKYTHENPRSSLRPLPANITDLEENIGIGRMVDLHGIEANIKACYFYTHMAAWTMIYYYHPKLARDDIFYPYLQAPLASDIFYHVDSYAYEYMYVNFDFVMKKSQMKFSISENAALAKIIPPSSDVFPENMKWLSSSISPISDFFPEEYSSTTLLARVSHERSAYIPPVDMAAMNTFLHLADTY